MSGRGKISKKLYVGNLSAEAGAEELREVFAAFGKLGEVVAKDGYGFVVSCPVCCLVGADILF